jgi:hypothetical protein
MGKDFERRSADTIELLVEESLAGVVPEPAGYTWEDYMEELRKKYGDSKK